MKQPTLAQILKRYLSRRQGLEFIETNDHLQLIVRYRLYEIMSVVGRDIWIRRELPEDRSETYVLPEDPGLFKKIDQGLSYAKKVVDEAHNIWAALEHKGVSH